VAGDTLRPGVVGGQGAGQVAAVEVEQAAQVARAGLEVGGGLEDVFQAQAEFGGGRGHELHESAGALGGDGAGIEGALCGDDAGDEVRVEAVAAGGLLDESVYAGRRGGHSRLGGRRRGWQRLALEAGHVGGRQLDVAAPVVAEIEAQEAVGVLAASVADGEAVVQHGQVAPAVGSFGGGHLRPGRGREQSGKGAAAGEFSPEVHESGPAQGAR
jgi:hypothetical protein